MVRVSHVEMTLAPNVCAMSVMCAMTVYQENKTHQAGSLMYVQRLQAPAKAARLDHEELSENTAQFVREGWKMGCNWVHANHVEMSSSQTVCATSVRFVKCANQETMFKNQHRKPKKQVVELRQQQGELKGSTALSARAEKKIT